MDDRKSSRQKSEKVQENKEERGGGADRQRRGGGLQSSRQITLRGWRAATRTQSRKGHGAPAAPQTGVLVNAPGQTSLISHP